jgi:hypothetical protein
MSIVLLVGKLVLPTWLPNALLIGNLVVDVWLLVVLYRKGIRKSLPWFVWYVVWEFVGSCVGFATWTFSREIYVSVYWWMEGIRVALMVAAVRESFLRTFLGFGSLRWFPWLVRGVISSVVVYSVWKAVYAPPIQSTRITVFLIGSEFTFRWGIAAVGILFFGLVWLFDLPRSTREDAIVGGCWLISMLILATVVSRSIFGTKYVVVTQLFPDVAYFVVALMWIKAFSRPELEIGFKELGIGPEAMARELRRYKEAAERIVRKRR